MSEVTISTEPSSSQTVAEIDAASAAASAAVAAQAADAAIATAAAVAAAAETAAAETVRTMDERVLACEFQNQSMVLTLATLSQQIQDLTTQVSTLSIQLQPPPEVVTAEEVAIVEPAPAESVEATTDRQEGRAARARKRRRLI